MSCETCGQVFHDEDGCPGPRSSFRPPAPKPALTLDNVRFALARCSLVERRLLVDASPHECALMLEAVFFLDATISDPAVAGEEAA